MDLTHFDEQVSKVWVLLREEEVGVSSSLFFQLQTGNEDKNFSVILKDLTGLAPFFWLKMCISLGAGLCPQYLGSWNGKTLNSRPAWATSQVSGYSRSSKQCAKTIQNSLSIILYASTKE